ncbi:MAG: hypothetical protein KJ955_02265 [Nanoarchaeota archaeon]|nr:hypothetical protein [Nanoarchaeota archaeon]
MRGEKKERIIKVLLTEKSKLSKYRVSKESGVSFSWVHEFLKKLEELKLVTGTEVKDTEGLIAFWSSFRKMPKYKEYLVQDPIGTVKNAGMDYAVTTYYAENIVQKFVFPFRLDIYIKKDEHEKWHKLLSKKGLYGKGNLRILLDDSGLFKAQKIKGISIVCLPQLIADLKREGGPSEEAAEMLLKRL